MWWTSDSKQSLNILCLCKYLSKSFETLKAETQDIMQNIFAKIGCHGNDVSPRPLQSISQNEA